jgi:hypothetical protein
MLDLLGALVPRRDGEPARELLTPLRGERIDVTVGLAALRFAPTLGQALGGQPLRIGWIWP